MPFTNNGAQFLAYAIGSSLPNNFISYMALGSGSGTALVTNSTLANELLRQATTGQPDFSVARAVTFQGDFSSVQMSGLTLTEWGLYASGASNTGSIWLREAFGSIIFDGTNELQILAGISIIPS